MALKLATQQNETFSHERLDAYRVATEFLELSQPLERQLPRTKGQLGDQLARASESILLRIAEGAGCSWGSADQRRHFRAARGSAMECAAILDICRVRRVGGPEVHAQGRQLLLRLTKMLTRLAKAGG
jgi:four helix bundle protein